MNGFKKHGIGIYTHRDTAQPLRGPPTVYSNVLEPTECYMKPDTQTE